MWIYSYCSCIQEGRNGDEELDEDEEELEKVQHGNGCCRRMNEHKVINPNIAIRRWDMSSAHSCCLMGGISLKERSILFPVFRFPLCPAPPPPSTSYASGNYGQGGGNGSIEAEKETETYKNGTILCPRPQGRLMTFPFSQS